MRLKFFVAFVLSLMLLAASKSQAGTPRIDNAPTAKVLVFSTTKAGRWHSRLGVIHAFTDAIIYACFEWPTKTQVACLVIADDGETLMLPLNLLEIKT